MLNGNKKTILIFAINILANKNDLHLCYAHAQSKMNAKANVKQILINRNYIRNPDHMHQK